MSITKKILLFSTITILNLNCFASEYEDIVDATNSIINLDKVRAENKWTGEGVIVGIIDTAINTDHPSLKNNNFENIKYLGNDEINNYKDIYENLKPMHGTHVAGIAVGRKLPGSKIYGVAHNAQFLNYPMLSGKLDVIPYLVEELKAGKDIKVLNNSWGKSPSNFPLINKELTERINGGYSFKDLPINNKINFDKYKRSYTDDIPYLLGELSKGKIANKKVLNVFASGNDGVISPSGWSILPSYDEEVRAWLNVGNLSSLQAKHNDDGSITLTSNYYIKMKRVDGLNLGDQDFSLFGSNHFRGATNYALMAPGLEVVAANANFDGSSKKKYPQQEEPKGRFRHMTGTSMATPVVTGAAALVAQKYPFLDGAQIADVLLTTANKNVKLPDLVLKSVSNNGKPGDIDRLGSSQRYYIAYLNKDRFNEVVKSNGDIDFNKIREDLIKLGIPKDLNDPIIKEKYNNRYYKELLIDDGFTQNGVVQRRGIITRLKELSKEDQKHFITYLTQEEYIGQGVLDVEKALKGLAILDINRLNDKDIENFKGENTAFYTINTNGLSGIFSNDISQQTWLDSRHLLGTDENGKPLAINILDKKYRNIDKIGLKKDGAGTLTLTGENSYKGPTRAVGGTLELKGTDTKKASIKGDAYAENKAKFIVDNAVVKQNAYTDNGTLEVKNNNEILGKTYAQNNGLLNLVKNSILKTSEVILESGSLTSDNDKTDVKATIEMNSFTAKEGKNNIKNLNLDIKANAINSAKSTLDILGNVFFNFTAATSSFNNFGNINIKDKLEIRSKTNYTNKSGSTLNLDTKDAIFYTLGNFINEGKLNFKTDAVDDLGLIIAGEKSRPQRYTKLKLRIIG